MNIIKKYRNLSAPVKASFWFLICGFLQRGISIITTPIFTRLLTTSQYGQYSVFKSWYGIITIFATLNISSGVFMQGLVKFENDKDDFTSSLQGLTTTTIIICGIIYLMFFRFWNKVFDLPFLLIISMFIDIFAITAFSFWSTRQRVDFKYKKLVILTLFNTIATPIVGIIAVSNLMYKVEARVLSSILIDLITFGYLYFIQAKSGKFYSVRYWKYALSFNLPLIPHYLSQVILNQADRLMINFMCGSDKAGIYSVAYSLSLIMTIFNNSVLNTLHPWIYKKIKIKEFNDIGNISYYILILIAFVNFLLTALAPEIISIMAPKEYYEAVWIVPPVAASVYFMFMYCLFADFEFYFEKTKFIMIASVASAILNIILNIIFIKHFGFIAAGYTTLICYIAYAIGHYLFMRKINKDFMNNVKVYNSNLIFLISFIFIIACALIMMLYNYCLIRYIVLFISILIIALQKDRIINLFKKIKSDE